jgi:hypothetical protein
LFLSLFNIKTILSTQIYINMNRDNVTFNFLFLFFVVNLFWYSILAHLLKYFIIILLKTKLKNVKNFQTNWSKCHIHLLLFFIFSIWCLKWWYVFEKQQVIITCLLYYMKNNSTLLIDFIKIFLVSTNFYKIKRSNLIKQLNALHFF